MAQPTLSAQVAKAVTSFVRPRKEDKGFLKHLAKSHTRAPLVEELSARLRKQFADQLPEDFDLEGLVESQLARLARSYLRPKEAREQRIIAFRRFLTDDIAHTLEQAVQTAMDKKVHTRIELERFAQETAVEIAQLLLAAKQEIAHGFDPKTHDSLSSTVSKLEARYMVSRVREELGNRLGITFIEEAKQGLTQLVLHARQAKATTSSTAEKAKVLIESVRKRAEAEVSDSATQQRIQNALAQLEKHYCDPSSLEKQLKTT